MIIAAHVQDDDNVIRYSNNDDGKLADRIENMRMCDVSSLPTFCTVLFLRPTE